MKTLFAFAVMALLLGCAPKPNADQSGEATMNQNKELVSEFFDHFSNNDIDKAFALVSDEASWWVPGDLPFSGTKTKAEYLNVVNSIQQGFPGGLQLKVTSMIAEGDKVAAEVESYGEHVNGRTYSNKYHFLITIGDRKMTSVKEYMDTLHLYQLIQP